MKTRESIEAQTLETPNPESAKTPRGKNPRSLANLVAPWTSETAPRNGGRPKKDISQEIARQAFENNKETIYKSYVELLLKGSAFGFQVLAERAYGKLKETRDTGSEFNEVSDADLNKRIAELERDLGLAKQIDEAGRTSITAAGDQQAEEHAENPSILS